jgi:RNA polymerase sigma-70 factor (ECF subfamily)
MEPTKLEVRPSSVVSDASDELVDGVRWSRLMASAQKGDRRAYETLLRDVVPYIRAIVAPHHRADSLIDDVVQDVLLTVHRARHTYDPARPFQAWLAVIARRRSVDAVRRRVRRNAQETSDDVAYETYADPAADRAVEVHDAANMLGDALAGLTTRQREAVELIKLKELSLAAASEISGQSVSALKVNMHRAIRALRIKLAGA